MLAADSPHSGSQLRHVLSGWPWLLLTLYKPVVFIKLEQSSRLSQRVIGALDWMTRTQDWLRAWEPRLGVPPLSHTLPYLQPPVFGGQYATSTTLHLLRIGVLRAGAPRGRKSLRPPGLAGRGGREGASNSPRRDAKVHLSRAGPVMRLTFPERCFSIGPSSRSIHSLLSTRSFLLPLMFPPRRSQSEPRMLSDE